MATAPVSSDLSPFDFPRLVAPYLPSDDDDAAEEEEEEDDDDDVVDTSFFADDSLDSFDDWSDDRPDSSDDSDPSSDSDDCSAAWTSKSKKHHSHPHAHLHKKSSFHSACDYLSFFGALRKGFCSRPLDQRIEVPKTHKRADKATLPGGGESAQQEKKRAVKAGMGDVCAVACKNRDSAGYNPNDHEGALSFGAMFKCMAADTPRILFKRANPSEDSDEQDMNAHEAGAENEDEKDLIDNDQKFSQRTEAENVPAVTMVLECDGKGPSKKSTDGPRLRENICKDMAQKENGEAHVESEIFVSRTNSEKRCCGRESDKEGLHNKGDSKPAMADCSNKSSTNPNQVALMVNTLESQDKDCVSLGNNAISQSKDLQGETTSSSDTLYEAAEMVDVPTSLDKKATQSEVSTDKAKLQDMPLHIYIKEKHQPEVVVKDPKRRAKAKKVKASKGKKLHLFRDGFTLPTATELAEDAESAPSVLDTQSESNNKVQIPKSVVKNQISKEVVSASVTEDDMQPPISGKIESNAMEVVDGVPLRDSTGPAATLRSIKTQGGNPISNDSDQAVVALPGSISKGLVYPSASYQNIEDGDVSKMSFSEGQHAVQPHPEAQISGFSEENSMRNVITSMPLPPQISSRRWFPRVDLALYDPVAAPELDTTLTGSPDPLVGKPLATSVPNYSSTALSHEPDPNSQSFENIQGNLVSSGNTDFSASLDSSSFIEAPSNAYHLGQRIVSRATVSSSSRISTMDTSNVQYSRFMQVPVSQNQAYASNSVSTMSLQQEINSPALFHFDGRASATSTWIEPGTNSGAGFLFPMSPTTASFGQVIGCNNQTLSMYKQMKSFSIEARYLVNVPSIVPGCCKLFLFNIESRQLHGVYVSSSLQAMAIDHEFPVAFDCFENYSLPLSIGELDTVLPEAKQMDGRPLFLQPHTVEQLVTMFERKNKSRLSWVPSTANPVSVSGVHGLLELSAVTSESSCTQDPLVEAMGSSVISASPASLATNEVATDCWGTLSSGSSVKVPESGHALVAREPFPASSINNLEGAKSVWPDVLQTGFTRKPPEQGVAPSPMALWPHLFPKASSADTKKESFMHMETREGNSSQIYHASLSEMIGMGARPDSESEAGSFSALPESGIRSNAHRPKQAYNPLAVEQGRQKHLFDGSKPSSWSTVGSELDLQQISQYGNRPRSQDKKFIASLSPPALSEQLKMNNISVQLSAAPSQLPLHYQMDPSLPGTLRSDLGPSKTAAAQITSAWNEEPQPMHLSTTPEIVPGAVNLDQTNICCYCFTRRADHLIIDCQHLGPCLECAASKKIEYCGQLNCQTKVTRLLRLFRPV